MNWIKMLQAQCGSFTRIILSVAGGCGLVVSSEQSDSIIQAIGQIMSGLTILIPILWAFIKNWRNAKPAGIFTK